MKKIYFIVLLFLTCSGLHAQTDAVANEDEKQVSENIAEAKPALDPISAKTAGDSAYVMSDFVGAIQFYEAIIAEGKESADLYYNLGNAYYKTDNIAKSIINYERALLLNPGNGDIKFNLELAKSKAVDKVTPMSEMFFVSWTRSLINTNSERGWAQIAIASFILTLCMLALYFFGKKILFKKIGFISAVVLILVCIVANVFASNQKETLLNHESAIVLSPNVTVKSTPDESGTELFILHEGRKVMIKDNSMKEWKEIQLEDGNAGWVPTNVIEII